MSKIIKWFETRPTRDEAWRYARFVLAIDVLIFVMYFIVAGGNGGLPQLIDEIRGVLREAGNTPHTAAENLDWAALARAAAAWVILAGVTAPLVEEFVFRLVPMTVAIYIFGWSFVTKPLIIVVACLSGIGFGIAHLINPGTTLSSVLFMQGTSGILLGLLFAKVSGMRGSGVWQAYRLTVLVHALWNIVILPIVALFLGLAVYAALSI